ncbi:CGNR zinc finger domain-containing protein [Nocardioides agariphilus]|uniref:CGNR zinc finger domain-containing protein n=1 Tax=Nocardioides agariphilus TaxID=433664 RepID=A0A930YPB4_9ACTN|nr:CGNR zinc finger domain-containing protein [Nocardioides agariphilus]
MVFAHDTELSLQAAVSLVNSAEPPDTLTSLPELEAFWTTFGYTGRHDRDEAELAAVRALRPRLRELLTANRDDAVALVNGLLEQADATPQLVRHDELDWHLHVVDPDRPMAERITAETAMAMIDVIRADEMSRLGVCAQDDCESIVLDLSRNRSKIFCGTTCSNRAAVAAYRARRSQ